MDITQRARNTASALISGRNGPNVCASAADLLVSLADEIERLRMALAEISRRIPGPSHEGVGDIARAALKSAE
jgi:hypothetical protein